MASTAKSLLEQHIFKVSKRCISEIKNLWRICNGLHEIWLSLSMGSTAKSKFVFQNLITTVGKMDKNHL